MVKQSGEDPAGGKDGKSAKPLPWKYIALAAIAASAVFGMLAISGIFSNPASIADTTATSASTGSISGASQPATNPGLALTDNREDDSKITKATRIPSPNEITQDRFIDISNPPKFVKANSNLVITEIEIDKNNNKIKANYLNTNTGDAIISKIQSSFLT